MTLIQRHQRIRQALHLIEFNMPINLIHCETGLRAPLLKQLYREHSGHAPPRGILPFTIDWYLRWRPNLHASLFANFYLDLERADLTHTDRLIVAYRHYLTALYYYKNDAPLLSVTRAWTLVRFCRRQMLQLTPCRQCHGYFITSGFKPAKAFICGACRVPPHAGHDQATTLRSH